MEGGRYYKKDGTEITSASGKAAVQRSLDAQPKPTAPKPPPVPETAPKPTRTPETTPSRLGRFGSGALDTTNIAMQGFGALLSAEQAGYQLEKGNLGYATNEAAGVAAGGLNVLGSTRNLMRGPTTPNRLGAAGDAFSFLRNAGRLLTGQSTEEGTIAQDAVSGFADALQVSQQLPSSVSSATSGPSTASTPKTMFEAVKNAVKNPSSIVQNVKNLPGNVMSFGKNALQNTKNFGSTALQTVKSLPGNIMSLGKNVPGLIKSTTSTAGLANFATGGLKFAGGLGNFAGNSGLFNSLFTGGMELNDSLSRTDNREIQDRNILGAVNTVNALDPGSAIGGMVDAVGGLFGADLQTEKTISLSRNLDRGLGMLGITDGKGETINEVANETLDIASNLQKDRGGLNRKYDAETDSFVARTKEDTISTKDLKTLGKNPDSRQLLYEGLMEQAKAQGKKFSSKIGGVDVLSGDLSKIDFSDSEEGRKNADQMNSVLSFMRTKREEQINNRMLPTWLSGDVKAEEDLGMIKSMQTEAGLLMAQSKGATGADIESINAGGSFTADYGIQPQAPQAQGVSAVNAIGAANINSALLRAQARPINPAAAAVIDGALARSQAEFGTPTPVQAQGMLTGSNLSIDEQAMFSNANNLFSGGAVGGNDIDMALAQHSAIQEQVKAQREAAANEAANISQDTLLAGPIPQQGDLAAISTQQTTTGGVSTQGDQIVQQMTDVGQNMGVIFGQNASEVLQGTFENIIGQFGQIAFPVIPDFINMQGQHKVEVIINGADALKGLNESIQNMITEQINEKVKWINNQTEGGLGP